ncbi:FtsX-like permease family protein [Octadecabacter sp. R77987]|uniref:FtsX-like permease family protein n=1 Tax=Octadecabacter sp. R77987 TaxID=3093874 RepID=UPI00366D38A7
MSRLLAALFGRLPIGWLQLTHSKGRLAAAIAGVAFANVLVFVQLGLASSMATATLRPYDFFNADIMISAQDANALTEGGNVARQWMFQALADPDVIAATPVYIGMMNWQQPDLTLGLLAFGIDPNNDGFLSQDLQRKLAPLRLQNGAIIDMNTRGLPPDVSAGIRPQTPQTFEVSGQTVTLFDTFQGGGGFASDGHMIMSDQSFLGLSGGRSAGAPDHIFLHVASGADPAIVAERLRGEISDKSLRIRSYGAAIQEDITYQSTQRPTGIIFGFGVVIGILVGIVIVYQVLSTDVADHMREYATFKAMGYGQMFFLGVVLEEALILAVFGFIPGSIIGYGLLSAMREVTTLPIVLTGTMAFQVFFGTLAACALSGALATRKLAAADPADLF